MSALEKRILQIAKDELRKAAEYTGFSKIAAQVEVFKNDPVWSHFGFDNEEFLRLRYVGNYYTSIFRKMGDMYERFVKAIVADRLGLDVEDLHYEFDVVVNDVSQKRSLDVAIDVDKITNSEVADRVYKEFQRIAGKDAPRIAVAEVRCCYQIGDSKRIQADETAAIAARAAGLLPVLMVFCSNSLASPIKRHRQRGFWHVVEGTECYDFLKAITDFDLYEYLKSVRPELQAEGEAAIKVFGP